MSAAIYIIGLPLALPISSTAGLAASLVDGLLQPRLPTTHGAFPMEFSP